MRKINEIIIHCTGTSEGRDVSVDEIREWHLKRGFNDIGYHYVIGLDGTLFSGRPIGQIGAHCKGHNRNSIGIVYVGGLSDDMQPKDTRTWDQKTTLKYLIHSICKIYPITSIVGHNNFANKACPCFNAQNEYSYLIQKLL